MLLDLCVGGSIRAVREFQPALLLGHRDAQDLGDVLAGTNLLGLLDKTFAAIPLAFGAGPLRAPQFGLEIVQGAPLFRQVLFNAADLFALQFRTEGDDERALLTPHLTGQAQSED